MPRQTVHRRLGGKLCVGRSASPASLRTDSARVPPGRSATLYDATTYTQFATWAAAGCLARRVVTRECEAGEAQGESVGNAGEQVRCRAKGGYVGGPWANVKNWRCEPLSFAYFSLRRQRKVGAAPHRGDA